ncbi:MAG: hypothetical protein AAF940_00220 [Pseudomonadota bacterium]
MTNRLMGQTFNATATGKCRSHTSPCNIMRSAFIAASAILGTLGSAAADPQGFYHVEGTEVDGTPFEGTVSVVRTGETYKVRWTIDGVTYHGTGLGAAPLREQAIIGPATHDDEVLIVGFASLINGFGISIYVQQPDGSWDGVWTEYGADHIATETWIPIIPALPEEPVLPRETSQKLEQSNNPTENKTERTAQ